MMMVTPDEPLPRFPFRENNAVKVATPKILHGHHTSTSLSRVIKLDPNFERLFRKILLKWPGGKETFTVENERFLFNSRSPMSPSTHTRDLIH